MTVYPVRMLLRLFLLLLLLLLLLLPLLILMTWTWRCVQKTTQQTVGNISWRPQPPVTCSVWFCTFFRYCWDKCGIDELKNMCPALGVCSSGHLCIRTRLDVNGLKTQQDCSIRGWVNVRFKCFLIPLEATPSHKIGTKKDHVQQNWRHKYIRSSHKQATLTWRSTTLL